MCVHSCTHRFFLSKGRGLSREECEREGHAAVYLAYLHEVLAIHVTPERERERERKKREQHKQTQTHGRRHRQTDRQTLTQTITRACVVCRSARRAGSMGER